MSIKFGQGVILTYLGLVLLLGGASAAGFGANTALQLLGAGLIAWLYWSERNPVVFSTGLRLYWIALALLAALQFVPLPPFLWHLLPGRDSIERGFEIAGMAQPWLPLSLNPWGTLQSVVWLLPALALFVAMRSSQAPAIRHAVWVIAAIAYASVVLAGLQAFQDSAYFYAITNRGNGVGAFANSNHFGSFMLITMALVAAQWLHDIPAQRRDRKTMPVALQLAALLAPLILGIFLSNSLACMLLMIPVLFGIYLLARPEATIRGPWLVLGGLVFSAGLAWLLASGFVANDLMSKSGTAGISRGEFLSNGLHMLKDFLPFGSGIGTFREIYPWYEDPARVGTTYVNHAHNDWLEFLIETGIFGAALLTIFGRWLVTTAWGLWSAARSEHQLALGATIAIGTVATHSLVDYPLRTAAISGLIALSCVVCRRPSEPRGTTVRSLNEQGAGKREEMLQI